MSTTTASPAINTETEIRVPAFTGRYAQQQEGLFKQSMKLFGFTAKQAEKFAKQAAQDAATAFNNAPANFKVGKVNEDGKATISDAAKQKGVTLTNSLNLVRAIQWIDEAGKNGVSYGNTKWQLKPELQAYADDVLAD